MPNIENECMNPETWEWGDKYPEDLDPDEQPDEFERLAAHLVACPFHAAWERRQDNGLRLAFGQFSQDEINEMLDQMAVEHPEYAPKLRALKDSLIEASERAQAKGLADLRHRMAEAQAIQTPTNAAGEDPPPDEDDEDGLAEQLWRD